MSFKKCAFLLFFVVSAVRSDRKITAELNPGCNLPECKNGEAILMHVKAEGSDDTLHHLWDFTGKPNILLVLTDKNATVNINWNSFILGASGGVVIEPSPKYVFGVVIDKVIEFNDEMNSGHLNQSVPAETSSYVVLNDTANYIWKVSPLSNNTEDAVLSIEATDYKDSATQSTKSLNGTIRIVMSAYGGEDHAEILPHLLHSKNSSQMDVIFDHVSTKYKSSRFGLNLITVSSEKPGNDSMDIKSRKTMDDEHAPGVFTIVEMVTPNIVKSECGGYLQWRPVVYTSAAREMTSSTETVQYSVMNIKDPLGALDHSLIWSTLGSNLTDMLVAATNVTFGAVDDGFYNKNQYTAWTMLIGYGHPPEEQFSMLVTLVLLLGLGLPAVLILTGTLCIIVRRLQRNKDDLFLSR